MANLKIEKRFTTGIASMIGLVCAVAQYGTALAGELRVLSSNAMTEVMAEVPAAFVGYDILASSSLLVIGSAWRERRSMLESLTWRDDGAFVAPYRLAKRDCAVFRAFSLREGSCLAFREA